MVDKNNYGVIMAGGIGSRFWPMSKSSFPKQFHDILGLGHSLLQMTFKRLSKIIPEENIFIVTNSNYKELVLEQLPNIESKQVLCEPFMRNTAPCIAYANMVIDKISGGNANIVVAPSDHLILNEDNFIEILELAIKETSNSEDLVTLGIKPSRPDTGYGYIQFEDLGFSEDKRVKKVKTFTEKPNLELAKELLASGDFYWNSGIFIWSLKNIKNAFEKHLPEMTALFESVKDDLYTDSESQAIERIYSQCENISIDYGIMERTNKVRVVLSDFGWSDLGTWGSLHGQLNIDAQGNGIVGDNVMCFQSVNNVVHVPKDKLVILQGLNDFIVVESEGTLLICKKEDEQKIKSIVSEVKIDKGDQFV